MKDHIFYIGASGQRTATNRTGHRVNISRNVLRAGLNLVATDLRSVLPVFASILEEVMGDDKRAICFHDDPVLQGISSAFNVLNIGGTIAGARIRESDGPYLAAYAIAHPRRNIFVNLSELDSGSPARLLAEFAKAYKGGRIGERAFELIAHYGIHRSITRSRDGIGDTRATHDAMRFQHLAAMRNIGILNAANSLSELPREFVMNCPNLAFGRIMLPKHYNELASHVPEDDMPRIRLCKKDDGYGVMKVPNGPLTYYPGSDVPNDLGRDMPFVLEPAQLKSDVGKDPKDPTNPRKNRHLEEYTTFVDAERDKKLEEAEEDRNRQTAERAVRSLKDKAVRAGAVAGVTSSAGSAAGVEATTAPRRTRVQRMTANDNAVLAACGPDDDEGIAKMVAMMLDTVGIAHADVLSAHARKVLSARGGLFSGGRRDALSAQAIGLQVIGNRLVREAILAGHAVSQDLGEGVISAAAVGASYLEALEHDEHLARRFLDGDLRADGSETLRRLRQVGTEASQGRRDESQFQIVRSAWATWRTTASALPHAA